MNKKDLQRIVSEVEQENSLFSKKSSLDTFSTSRIIGRDAQTRELVKMFLGYRQGLVVPFVSVYGRSGGGKSTIVRFVCENLDDVRHCFVNLRKAKTVFGCANLILAELGEPNLKNAQGINLAMEKMGDSIEELLQQSGKKMFVLVLDELDALFLDKRGKPSDFIYKLVSLEEKLYEKGLLMCIVGVSNNVMTEFDLDDRVRSRIGSSEVFFEAYAKKDVLAILEDRAREAFSKPVDPAVMEYCAAMSSTEHGDARRAIDLLRVAAEIASVTSDHLEKSHVDQASQRLQKDRTGLILSTASHQFKLVCSALARVTLLSKESWHSTSMIYKQYQMVLGDDVRELTYRRVSELLMEMQNTGLAVSQTLSKGRHGYGTQYRLAVSPETIGIACFPDWWNDLEKRKGAFDAKRRTGNSPGIFGGGRGFAAMRKMTQNMQKKSWEEFSGFD